MKGANSLAMYITIIFYSLIGLIGMAMLVCPLFLFRAFERYEHEEYHEKNDYPIGW